VVIQFTEIPKIVPIEGLISPLNAVWYGKLSNSAVLPQMGHIILIFPIDGAAVNCSGITIDTDSYVFLRSTHDYDPVHLKVINKNSEATSLLVLWLSPPFIVEMAGFLIITENLRQLLHGVPLLRGDQISRTLSELAKACYSSLAMEIIEELFLEIVGEVLKLMRVRHLAIQKLSKHKNGTIDDLLPKLQQARQFIEARYSQKFKTRDVANIIGLSEYHFARLFKAAFEITIRQYVIRLRLDAAKHLLEQMDMSVTQTSLEVGYSSLSTFIHAFNKRFGLNPSQYQDQKKMSRI